MSGIHLNGDAWEVLVILTVLILALVMAPRRSK
jgi:hypothetical protein